MFGRGLSSRMVRIAAMSWPSGRLIVPPNFMVVTTSQISRLDGGTWECPAFGISP